MARNCSRRRQSEGENPITRAFGTELAKHPGVNGRPLWHRQALVVATDAVAIGATSGQPTDWGIRAV